MQPGPPELSRKARQLIARIRRDSSDVEAVRELEAHYAEVGDHGSLANLLAGWAEILTDGRQAADALMRGANAILIGLGDRERACMFLEHALTRCPTHEGAMHQLTQLLTQAKDHERLRHCLRRVTADLEGEAEHAAYQAQIEFRLGKLCEDVFEQPGKAVLRYRRAIELLPTMLPAIVAARRIYADTGDHGAVASLLEFEIRATDVDEDKVPLLAELARIRRERLHDWDEAVRTLRKALQLQPHNASLLIALAETLGQRVSTSRATAEDAQRAAELYYQAARLLPDTEVAPLLDSALALDPTHTASHRWRAQLGAPPVHPSSVPAPRIAAQPAAAPLPPRQSSSTTPRSSTAPPRRSSILPPAPAGASRPSAPPPPAPVPSTVTDDTTTQMEPLALGDDEATRVAPSPLADTTPDDDATRVSPIPTAPVPNLEGVGLSQGPESARAARAEVDAWIATPASDTTPLDTQGLRPIDGSTLSDPPPPPEGTPPLRSAAAEPDSPVRRPSKDLVDRMTRLRSRLKRRPSVTPPPMPQVDVPAPEPAAARQPTTPTAPPVPPAAPVTAPVVAASPAPAAPPQPVTEPAPSGPVAPPSEAPVSSDYPPAEDSKLVEALTADDGRTALEVNIGPSTESNFYSGFDGTVANGGVFFATYDTLAVDTPVALTITLPGGFIAEAHGHVRFVRDVFDFDAHADPGLGVQFEAMTRESLELMERFAQKRTPIFFE